MRALRHYVTRVGCAQLTDAGCSAGARPAERACVYMPRAQLDVPESIHEIISTALRLIEQGATSIR